MPGEKMVATKKEGEVACMFEMLNAKMTALESNLHVLTKGIEPILSSPHPQVQTKAAGATENKFSSPLAVELCQIVDRLTILIETSADCVERNQL